MDPGSVYVADVGQERRIRVVVLSNGRYNRHAARVVVVPQFDGPPDGVPSPWRVSDGDRVYAVDFVLSLATERLLEVDGHVSASTLRRLRDVLLRIT